MLGVNGGMSTLLIPPLFLYRETKTGYLETKEASSLERVTRAARLGRFKL